MFSTYSNTNSTCSSQLATWFNPDPMMEKYCNYTPYNYCVNNPVNFIDPTGMDPNDAKDFLAWLGENWGKIKDGSNFTFYFNNGNLSGGQGSCMPEIVGDWLGDRGFEIRSFNRAGNLHRRSSTFNKFAHTYVVVPPNLSPSEIKKYYNPKGQQGIEGNAQANGNATSQGGFDLGDGLGVAGKVNSVANGFYGSVAKNSGNSTVGSNGYTYFAKSGQRGFYGNQYVTTKSLSSVGRASKFLGPAGHAISLGQVGYGVYQDGGTFGYNAQVATGSAVGGFAGGLAGAKAGAAMGGAIGAFFGGVGAVPGAIIGGFVGGVVGGFYGGKAGEAAVNYYY